MMQNKGNILLVANWESDVGYAWWLMENFWQTIADHFVPRGHACFLIYPRVTKIPDAIARSDITIIEHDFNNRSLTNLKKLGQLIRKNNIRYLYLTDAPFRSIFYMYLHFLGIRKIIVHDHTPGDRTAPPPWLKLIKCSLQRISYYTADGFIAVTAFVYERFIKIACLPRNKCYCAPNGIVPIDIDKADKRYAQKAFGIPEDSIVIVSTGRATYYKGIDFFIKCANTLINHRGQHKLYFLYCGDGPDIDDFRNLVREYNLSEHFIFAGNRSDIREILPSCHIGFHTAKGEVGYSLSILEYMSAGLATIVPNHSSTNLSIDDGINGLFYTHGNTVSACEAITKALGPAAREFLGNNSREKVLKCYTLRETNNKLKKILDDIIR